MTHNKPSTSEKNRNNLFDQLLTNFQKKYVFAMSFTNYRDITIVSFPINIKMLIFSKSSQGSEEKPMS